MINPSESIIKVYDKLFSQAPGLYDVVLEEFHATFKVIDSIKEFDAQAMQFMVDMMFNAYCLGIASSITHDGPVRRMLAKGAPHETV